MHSSASEQYVPRDFVRDRIVKQAGLPMHACIASACQAPGNGLVCLHQVLLRPLRAAGPNGSLPWLFSVGADRLVAQSEVSFYLLSFFWKIATVPFRQMRAAALIAASCGVWRAHTRYKSCVWATGRRASSVMGLHSLPHPHLLHDAWGSCPVSAQDLVTRLQLSQVGRQRFIVSTWHACTMWQVLV